MSLYSDKEIELYISERGLDKEDYIIIDSLAGCDEARLDYEKWIFVRNLSPHSHASKLNKSLIADYICSQEVKSPRRFELFGVVANEQAGRANQFLELVSGLLSLETLFQSVPFLNRTYDESMTFQYIESRREGQRVTFTLLFRCFDNFTDISYLREHYWALGMLTAVPRREGYRKALGRVLYFGYALRRLLTEDYAYMSLEVEEREDGLYIGGVRYAERAFLKKRGVKGGYTRAHRLYRFLRGLPVRGKKSFGKDIFTQRVYEEGEPRSPGDEGSCYMVIKDLYDAEGEAVIKAGELYDLPYSCFEVEVDLSVYDRGRRKRLKREMGAFDIRLLHMRAQVFELEKANMLASDRAREAEEAGRELEGLKGSLEESNKRLTLANEQLKRVVEELKAAKQEIERVDRERTKSFISFAHEARTPLTLIANYLDDYLKKRKYAIEDRELMIIKRNIDSLERDMVNFLDCEKLLRGELGFNSPEIVDLSRLLSNRVTLFKESARRSQIRVEAWIGEGIYTLADESALDRVINNLLDNALKYTGKKGTVKVGLKIEGDELIFTVEDNGIGISADSLESIFLPYYRVNSSKSALQGIGMGLTIVKRVVELLGGEIKVESVEGKGTLFTVALSCCRPKRSELVRQKERGLKAQIVGRALPAAESKKRVDEGRLPLILIVENCLDIVHYYRERFEGVYRVHYALSAGEGLEMLESGAKPQVILLDLMLDEIDGYDFLEELAQMAEFNDIPVICITAKTGSDEKVKALKAGAVDFITKPFLAAELIARIDSLIRLRQNRRTAEQAVIFQQNCDRFELSPKEREIAALLIKGKESKEIALQLGKALSTVNNQLYNMFEKTGVRTRGELMVILKTPHFGN